MKTGKENSTAFRFANAAFGLLFAAIAVAIVIVSDRSLGPILTAIVIGILGVDAVASAIRNKQSLLSRIGPLP